MTRQALAALLLAVLAVEIVEARGTALESDLSITKTDGVTTYTAGGYVTYTIVVENDGPDPAVAAAVSDPVTALSQVASAWWTCLGAAGATCAPGPVDGDITDTVDLPVGGTATYTLLVKTTPGSTSDLVNTATVTPPAGTTDPGPGVNTASDTDTSTAIAYYVATTGVDSKTCGSTADPCLTVQAAIEKTKGGDAVIVGDGTFNECIVLVPGTGSGGILVASSQFFTTGLVGATSLDGADVCDAASPIPAPVAKVFDGSALRGFAITNGGDSAVWGLGAVTISNNSISGNETTTVGGGIYLSTGPNLTDPKARAEIKANTIKNNTSGSDGAGIYVDASAQGVPSRVAIDGNTVSTNTAGGTTAAFGGGIAVFTATASDTDASSVVITNNTIDGNTAEGAAVGAAIAYGGGIFVATGAGFGRGTEAVTVGALESGNIVRNNNSSGLGGGMSINAQPAPGGKHTIHVDANTISANTGSRGGGGLHLFAYAFDGPAGAPEVVLGASGNSLTGNHALGDLSDPFPVGGGGIYAELYSERTVGSAVTFEIADNTIESNDATTHGGGASLVASADDDPQNDGVVRVTGAVISFHNNLVAENAARDTTASVPSGGGVYGLAIARGDLASAQLAASFLTVADNETELGTGGLEWEDLPLPDSLGLDGTASFSLSNSIVSGNDGYGVGYAAPLDPSTTVDLSYNDAYGNISGDYEAPLGDPTGTSVSVDPELDALFLPRICGPMVDQGDPAIPSTNEPQPNGGQVNLGHLGNTESATRTFPDVNSDGTVDGLDVMGIAVSFNSCTDPSCDRPNPAADRDLNGIVDGQDLAYVSAFYAQTCP